MVGHAVVPFSTKMKTFGRLEMPAGYYLYCGSAHGPGGLASRINRHLNPETKLFWHFDYLKRHLIPEQIWWRDSSDNFECTTAQFLLGVSGGECPVPGFGASDCRQGCPSHLIFVPKRIQVNRAWSLLQDQAWNYQKIVLQPE